MKLIECADDLRSWDGYQELMKMQLKLLGGAGDAFFVSKEKFDFEIADKPWNGFAVLVGAKGAIAARKLQKEGVLFREGTCGREGKLLRVDGIDPRLLKAAAKTLKKLMLGYKIAGVEEEGDDAAEPAGPPTPADAPAERAKKLDELKKLGSDLDRLLAALNR